MRAASFLTLFIAFQAFSQDFKEQELETSIKEVTVFLNGAQITRTGEVEIKAGKSILTIKSLSPHIDEKSIQVNATGELTILSINHEFDYLNERKKDVRVDSLNNQLALLDKQIKTKSARLLVLSEKQSLLDANKNLSGEIAGTSLSQLKQAIEFYDVELTKLKKEELDTQLEIEDLKHQKSRISSQISDVLSQNDLPVSQIEIRVNAPVKTTGKFKASYLVANAGWYPNYDARVKDVESPLQLTYKADVYQNTGVDWNNVKLTFSNGDPNQSGVVPELPIWYLNYARNTIYRSTNHGSFNGSVRTVSGKIMDSITGEPLPGATVVVKGTTVGTVSDLEGRYQITLPNGAEYLTFSYVGMHNQQLPITHSEMNVRLEEDAMLLEEVVVTGYEVSDSYSRSRSYSKPRQAKSIKTTAIANQTTVVFEVAEPYTLKSNSTKLSVDLNEFYLETLYEYYAVPKLDKDAFLMARIINWDQYNLLEGEANLFFEDAYIGRSVLGAKSLSDTLDLSFGRDLGITIERTKNEDFSKKRTIGTNRIDSKGFDIIARNNKAQPIKLTLFDQIPKAVLNEISVEATKLSGGNLEEDTGKITWELALEPKEKSELVLRYEVKYPKRERVNLE